MINSLKERVHKTCESHWEVELKFSVIASKIGEILVT